MYTKKIFIYNKKKSMDIKVIYQQGMYTKRYVYQKVFIKENVCTSK